MMTRMVLVELWAGQRCKLEKTGSQAPKGRPCIWGLEAAPSTSGEVGRSREVTGNPLELRLIADRTGTHSCHTTRVGHSP